jgi:hypothetical protein
MDKLIKVTLVGLLLLSSVVFSAEQTEQQTLMEKTNALKTRMIELNRELFLLEQDLLHPASTRVALYVSMNMGQLFHLDSVKIKLNGEPVDSFLYTKADRQALIRGAIQPLFITDLATGEHELVALFTGIGPHNRPYKRAVTLNFEKADNAKAFEVQIKDDEQKMQPKFAIKAW